MPRAYTGATQRVTPFSLHVVGGPPVERKQVSLRLQMVHVTFAEVRGLVKKKRTSRRRELKDC